LANLFDSTNYPTNVPDELVVGDRWVWKRTAMVADYPVASYQVKYSFRLLTTAATEISITASENSSPEEYLVEVAAATTAAYTAGDYTYQEYIIRSSDSERFVFSTGVLIVKPDLDADTSDPRSNARIILDGLQAMLENRATIDQMSMSIAGRSLSRMTPAEIRDWERHYKYLVSLETKKMRIEKGQATGSQVVVKF
tara:strand:- start:46 stop:636 length:591 start_codon:yes stop_codon:yes gene_type:complete